ncbi:MAG: hypothetical protein P8Y94_16455 [Acidobacteriota bacterium]
MDHSTEELEIMKKQMTMGLIVGNRGFFPDRLAEEGRTEMIGELQNAGMKVVCAVIAFRSVLSVR